MLQVLWNYNVASTCSQGQAGSATKSLGQCCRIFIQFNFLQNVADIGNTWLHVQPSSTYDAEQSWRMDFEKFNPIRPGLFSRSPGLGEGASETWMPKINWLKWNLVWVITAIKAFVTQNLSLVALPVLEMWCHKIFLGRRKQSSNSAIYPRKTGLTLKKMSFYVHNRSSRPKIDLRMSIPALSFLGCFDEKRAAATPWLTNFAKIWSEHVLKIKTKSHSCVWLFCGVWGVVCRCGM